MIAIGNDFGLSKSGVVVLNDKFEIEEQNLITVSIKSKGAQRLVEIERGYDSIIQRYCKDDPHIFIEGYAYGARYQKESLAELGGVIRRYLYLRNLEFWIIPPTMLKLFVTGNGRATKNFMKKCTKEKWGHSFKSDDVCDAHGLARLSMCVAKVLTGVQGYAHLNPEERNIVKEIILHPETYKNRNTAGRKLKQRKKEHVNSRKRTT